MKVAHLNYSRQLAKHCDQMLSIPGCAADLRALCSNTLDLHGASTKFILPDGGRLFDDKEYRALDETQPLRLPFPYVALEYQSNGLTRASDEPIGSVDGVAQFESADSVSAPKRIVFARERGEWIVLTVAFWVRHGGVWRILPECAIPSVGYLNRSQSKDGRAMIMASFADPRIPMSDYMDELGALLCFLNVLQCANVRVERSDPKSTGKKIKAALPFDSYHILTIGSDVQQKGVGTSSSHRSPREHLRRGHIRRLIDGRRIWVNASVVAGGRGAGSVSKSYKLAA